MPSLQTQVAHSTYDRPAAPRRALALAAAAAVLILVAVAWAATMARHANAPASAGTRTAYVPLIQYRGTGAAPVRTRPIAATNPPTTGLRRAEHSYGAVP